MDKLPFRQIHLDFHTSEHMPGVGSEFSEENFKKALELGHVNSISLFAKCHHGWAYFPSKVNAPHPTMTTNLLDRQLKVCEEMGVRTQIYISAGLDERKAVLYPQFRNVRKNSDNTPLGAHWHGLCLNNDDYLAMLCAEVEEVMQVFAGRFDGIFLDICSPTYCVCDRCIDSMMKLGLDPENDADLEKHRAIVFDKYYKAINASVAKYDPEMPIIHNCGGNPVNYRGVRMHCNNKHFEIESLPTGGWGYDHFPLFASHVRTLGREFSGMTGKFHKSWGEFGGFKHPNALKYEASLSLANGAKCCVGDQLHPLGKFEEATYRLIGEAYAEVEKKEAWCHDVKAIADIAVYTPSETARDNVQNIGANRMLLEGKYLYNIIDAETDLCDYKAVIFPDNIVFDDELCNKVNDYLAKGGKILLSGISGTKADGKFFRNFGIEYIKKSEVDNAYLIPTYDMKPNGVAPYSMYMHGHITEKVGDIGVMAEMQDSYFNRTLRKFCSHGNTPNNPESHLFGAGVTENIGYIAWDIFTEYSQKGAYHAKRIVLDILEKLIGDTKTIETDLQSNGVITLMDQACEGRLVNHLLYCVTKKRGDTEVIEDAVPVYNTSVSIKLENAPKRVYIAPEGKDIDYKYDNGVLSYTVPEFTFHTMVVIDK